GNPAGFGRARRDPLACRPGAGHVRRQDRGGMRSRNAGKEDRPDDGGRPRMSRSARELPAWVDAGLIPLLNLIAAFFVTGIVILIIGESPIESVEVMINGAFGYGEGLGYTLFYTTNFIFTGLAFAVAPHAGLFNIGTEGQAYIGGLGGALVCLGLGSWPMPVVSFIPVIPAALFCSAWAFL